MAKKFSKVEIEYSVVNNTFKKGIRENTQEITTLNKEFKLQKEQMKNTATESEKLEAEIAKLNKEYEVSQEKTRQTASALQNTKDITGEASNATRIWNDSLIDAQKNEEFLKNRIQETTLKLDAAKKAEIGLTEEQKKNIQASQDRQSKLEALETSQERLSSSSDKLTKEYELQVAELGNNARASDKAKIEQQHLADQMKNSASQISNLEKQLSIAKKEFGENSQEVDKLEKSLLDAKLAGQEFANSYKDSTDKLKNFGEAAGRIGSQMKDIGGGLTKGLTVPLLAVGGGSIKAASDFDSAAAGMRKTVDELVDENGKVIISYKDLEGGIRDMSKELPASATQIAEVAESAGQLGIKTENVLTFSRTMIDMGESTNLAANDAATSLARLANITGMNQKDFDKLGSSIVALGNNFATTESEITAMALRLAGAGKQIGMSESDILALSASLSSVGIEAESGGSSMSKLMVDMQLASSKGIEAFNGLQEVAERNGISWDNVTAAVGKGGKEVKNMSNSMGLGNKGLQELYKNAEEAKAKLGDFGYVAGMTGDEFAKAFKEDAVGAIGAFIEGLSHAEERGTTAIEMLDNMGISEVRLRDSLLRAGGASELFTKAIGLSSEAWDENSALTNEAAQRYETFESKLKTLKNQIVDVAIEFGGPLMDALSSLLETLQPVIKVVAELAKKFSEADPKTQKFIIALGLIVMAIGPVVSAIGTVLTIMSVLAPVIGAIATFFGITTVAAGGLLLVIPLIVAAIAALIAAIVIYWEDISNFFKELGASIAKFFDSLGKDIKKGFGEVVESFQKKVDEIKAYFSELGKTVGGFFEKAIEDGKAGIKKKIDDIGEFFTELKVKIGEKIEAIKEYFEPLFNVVSETFGMIGSFFETLGEGIALAGEAIYQIVTGALTQLGTWIMETFITPLVTLIKQKFDEFIIFMTEVGQKFKKSVIDPVVELKNDVVRHVTETVTELMGNFNTLKENAGKKWQEIKESITKPIIEAKNDVLKWGSDIWTGLVDIFDKLKLDAGKKFIEVKNAVMEPINDMKDGIKKAIDSISDFFAKIKFPRFGLKTSTKTIFGKEISYPSGIDVKWNKKGAIFKKPVVAGMYNGVPQGFGDGQESELALPLNASNLGMIGEGVINASDRALQRMMDNYMDSITIKNETTINVVSEMDSKKVGEGTARIVDDNFENRGTDLSYGVGRRNR